MFEIGNPFSFSHYIFVGTVTMQMREERSIHLKLIFFIDDAVFYDFNLHLYVCKSMVLICFDGNKVRIIKFIRYQKAINSTQYFFKDFQ